MAATNFQVFNVPGRKSLKLPIVGNKENNEQSGISKATHEWEMIISGISDKFILFGVYHSHSRETIGNATTNFFPEASTHTSDLRIIVQLDSRFPVLEQCMNNGTCLNLITIIRKGWVNSAFLQLEKKIFYTCYVSHFMQVLDYVIFQIRTLKIEEDINVYNQDGTPSGVV
ncbi:MAG: hypothetical protein LBS83_02315 [Holosporales bacterium]|jgi:hypothetical protein|nr:hypothetical protein [Holosporales bacterium]